MMQNSTTTTISGIGVGGGSSASTSSTSSRQEQQFVQDLVQFYRTRGVNNAHAKQFVVRLNGKVVNLSELYSLILECGGSFKVNQINLWDEIYCRLFKTTSVGANFAVALRQVYNRYLLQYEKNCSGQSLNSADYQQWNEEEDEENLFSNTNLHSSALAAQVHASRADLNNVLDGSSGQVHNDSKLYCSLLSGLPNELNFAFNVATILSNCNRFDWAADYKFVNVLLESMKSYCCICDQFEEDVAFGRRRPDDYHHNSPHDDEFLHFQRLITSSISTLERGRSSGRRKEDRNSARNNATTTPTLNGHCTEETTSPADISITSTNSSSLSSSSSASSSSSSSAVSFRPPKRKAAIEFTDRRCNCYRQFWSRMCLDEEVLARVLLDDHDDDDYCCSLDLDRLGGGSGGGGGSRSAAALSSPTAFADIPAPLMKKIEQRIELIGGIILNISVTYEQQQQQQKEGGGGGGGEPNRVAMLPLLKLLLLMVRSTSPSYLALALDILANIAPALSCYTPGKLQQPLYAYLLDGTLRSVVELATTSAHLHHTTKSLEILARYIAACGGGGGGGGGGGSGVVGGGGGGGAEANAFLETYFENVKLCERITQLLTCQYDIALLLALLEFCLTLSETRPFLLVQSDGKILIKLLVNLLNCEASTYFTTGAFRKVKVIDDRPRSEQQPQQLLQQQPSVQQTAVLPGNVIPPNGGNVLINRQPTMATTMVTTTTGTASTTINHTNQHHPHHQQQQVVIVNRGPLPPNSTQAAAPNPAPATATPTIGSVAVQNQTVVAAVNQHILDNESFAISWLRSTYEDAPGSSFKVGDIYAEYLKHCCRNARKNVIATQSFGYLIKRCFPAVNLNNSLNHVVQAGGGGGNQNTGTIIEGLAVKGALVAPGGPGAAGATATSIIGGTVVSQHPQLMSPILKAHLSTPPKSSCLAAGGQTPGSPQQTLEQPTTPTTPTAPPASAAPNSTTSTLIKSLLANKLRNNQNTTLVTTPPPPLARAPSGSVKLQPIGTSLGGSQPLIIANNNSNSSSGSSSATTAESKADLKPQNAQPQPQQVVFATSNSIAAPTTTFANSYIVQQQQPNSQLQQQQPGHPQPGQQILLVRTVLASQPGQQSPVRLLLPASMVGGGAGGGQRLVVPAGATTNGQLVMTPQASVVVQPQANTAAAASQPKAVPTASAVNSSSSSSSSTIANSSPLLNVLLDKGKLPDFPSAASASSTTSAANSSSTSNTSSSSSTTTTTASAVVVPSQTSTVSSSVAAGQPKMYVLTTKPGPATTTATNASTEPSAANNNNNNSVVDGKQPNSSTPQLNNNNSSSSSSAPPLVNGDVGGGSCGQKQQQQLANSNSAIKHALESSSSNPKAEDDEAETEDEKEEGPPSAKRLKTAAAAAAAAHAEQNDGSGETAKGTPTIGSAVQVATNHVAEAKVVVANGTMAKSGGETAVSAVTPPPPPPTVVTNGPIQVDQSTTTPNAKSALPVEKQSATTGNAETLTATAPAAAAQQPPSAVAPSAPATSAPPAAAAAAATPATPKTQAQAPPPPAAAAPTPPKVEAPLDFECQWGDCRRKFARPSEVFYHVHCEHIMTASFPAVSSCQWGGPEGKGPGCLSKRPKLSLLTHLQDFHCNANNLKQELLRRRQLQVMGTTNILLAAPPAHPGYAQNAAMLAIRRHAANFADTGASTGPPPSPLTVSIRLTSALILRNLAQRSHLVKKSLELFEPQLCEISIAEGREEARTIAQCLAVIADQGR